MKKHFQKFIKKMSSEPEEGKESFEEDSDYIEINSDEVRKNTAKIMLKYFVLNDFSDVKPVLDSLRTGYTIGLVKISPLKEKDLNELKRAVSKIKKTCYALEGDLIGIDQNWLVAVPSYVSVFREKNTEEHPLTSAEDFEDLD